MKYIVLYTALLVSVIGCASDELVKNLTQRDSLEILFILNRAGINGERTMGRKADTYDISVDRDDYHKAIDVLHQYGFPRDPALDLDTITRQKGFIPNIPEMNDVRLDLALSTQVERLVTGLPGILDAKALVRYNFKKQLGDADTSTPSASVVIRYISPSGKLPFSMEEVKDIVANSVPGLTHDKVIVTIEKVVLPEQRPLLGMDSNAEGGVVNLIKLSPFTFGVPESEKVKAQKQLAAVLGLSSLCAAIVGIYFGWKVTVRRRKPGPRAASDSFFIEGNNVTPANLTQNRPTNIE